MLTNTRLQQHINRILRGWHDAGVDSVDDAPGHWQLPAPYGIDDDCHYDTEVDTRPDFVKADEEGWTRI